MAKSKTAPAKIFEIIDAGDRESFLKLPGAGGKQGAKIIEKVFATAPAQGTPVEAAIDEDAVAALRVLQYDAKIAREAVKAAQESVGPNADTSAIVTRALQLCAKK